MNKFARIVFGFALCTLPAALACAQSPEVGYLFPSDVAIGRTTEVELIGKKVDNIERLYCSTAGFEAKPLGKSRFAVTIAADAKPGEHDIYALSSQGLSIPFRIVLSEKASIVEKEPNSTPSAAEEIETSAVVYGRIDPATDRDWYRVKLAAGARLTISCRSTTLGGTDWPALVVIDPAGREIAHDGMTHFEPFIHVTAPAAGEYRIGVQDRAYRATPLPFYRLQVTTGPWLSAAVPITLERGKSQKVSLYGYQLPGGKLVGDDRNPLEQLDVDIVAPNQGEPDSGGWTLSRAIHLDSFTYRHPGMTGQVRFELLDRPLVRNLETVRTTSKSPTPMELKLPADVVGRFVSSRHTVDSYSFTAKAGQTIWFESTSERLNRPCDIELVIQDAQGKVLETVGNTVIPKGEPTAVPWDSRDPSGSWKAPADGTYLLAVRDLLGVVSGLSERAYRLSVGPRLEDVRVVAVLGELAAPKAWSIQPSKTLKIPLVIIRRGGHGAKVDISVESLPAGLSAKPLSIAGKQATGELVIEAAKNAAASVATIRIVARTEVERKPLVIEAQVVTPVPGTTPPLARLCEAGVVAVIAPTK